MTGMHTRDYFSLYGAVAPYVVQAVETAQKAIYV
jgi:hypothetical protein